MAKTLVDDNQNEEPCREVEEADRWRLRQESESNQSVNEVRSKIHVLLDFFVSEGLATEETVDKYRAAADEYRAAADSKDNTAEGLTGFHHWIVEKRFMAIRAVEEIENEIGFAVAEKILSGKDRDDLMSQLVLTDQVDFVGQADRIQEAVRQTLGEMEADRKEFDAIAAHPLVKEGLLHITDGREIKIPDLEAFLEMPVQWRRVLLVEIRKSLPKAEHNKEREESLEALRLEKEFHELLAEARKEGVIGFAVAQRFKKFFRELDNEAKSETIESLDEILEPYAELWEEIRETFEGGRPLALLEGLRDLLDHQQLRGQFEKTVAQECVRLDWEYAQALEKASAKKILPSHVQKEWNKAMRVEDLEGKRERLESFDEELEPYAELREEIDELVDPEQVLQLNSMYQTDLFGLEEIQVRLKELTETETNQERDEGPDENVIGILSKVRRNRVRDSILETSEELDVTQKKNLVRRLTHYLDGRLSHEYKDYDDNVKDAWVEQKKAVIKQSDCIRGDEEEDLLESEEILEDESDEIVLPIRPHSDSDADPHANTEAEAVKVIEIPKPEAETNDEETFEETINKEDTRVVKMETADGEAVDKFNSNALLNEKKDKLSLVTGGEKFDVELNLDESRALVDFLKHDLKKEEEIKMAA